MNQGAVIETPQRWTKVIEPQHSLLQINWKEIWQYRDLIYLLVKRDFTAQYKQTILGPLWFLIQPILSSSIFTIIFSSIAGLSTDKVPPFLFYMCGLVAWGYFSDCLTKSAGTFSSNASIFSKVYFPRLTVPIANAITNLLTFGIQLGLFLVIPSLQSSLFRYCSCKWPCWESGSVVSFLPSPQGIRTSLCSSDSASSSGCLPVASSIPSLAFKKNGVGFWC